MIICQTRAAEPAANAEEVASAAAGQAATARRTANAAAPAPRGGSKERKRRNLEYAALYVVASIFIAEVYKMAKKTKRKSTKRTTKRRSRK